MVFSESVGRRDSNETELLAIRRALTLWAPMRRVNLIIKGDLTNAIKLARGLKRPPWKMATVVREIRALCLGLEVSF